MLVRADGGRGLDQARDIYQCVHQSVTWPSGTAACGGREVAADDLHLKIQSRLSATVPQNNFCNIVDKR